MYILKEQQKQIKTWLMIVIMKVLDFLSLNKIFARLKRKIMMMYFVVKMTCPVGISDENLKIE